MLLSVVLPVRNGEPFIREAIRSILDQSLTELELIVVDNGSTDSTVTTAESFGDPRLRVIHELERRGGPSAFNSGSRVARGRYVARMDADDVACADRCERQIRYLERNPDIGILGGQAIRIDAAGETIGRSRVATVPVAFRLANRRASRFVHPTFVFRREVLDELGGYREFSPAADYDLVLRALERGLRIGNLPDVVLKYRVLADSVSHRSRQRTLTFARAVKRMSRLRRRGRIADEQATLRHLMDGTVREGTWFGVLDRCVSVLKTGRNRCIQKGGSGMIVHLATGGIGALSALHPLLMQDVWGVYRALRIEARYRRMEGGDRS